MISCVHYCYCAISVTPGGLVTWHTPRLRSEVRKGTKCKNRILLHDTVQQSSMLCVLSTCCVHCTHRVDSGGEGWCVLAAKIWLAPATSTITPPASRPHFCCLDTQTTTIILSCISPNSSRRNIKSYSIVCKVYPLFFANCRTHKLLETLAILDIVQYKIVKMLV